jgi:hypothetical protein
MCGLFPFCLPHGSKLAFKLPPNGQGIRQGSLLRRDATTLSTILGMAQPIIPPVLEIFSRYARAVLHFQRGIKCRDLSCSRAFDEFSTPHDGMTSVPVSQDLAVRIENMVLKLNRPVPLVHKFRFSYQAPNRADNGADSFQMRQTCGKSLSDSVVNTAIPMAVAHTVFLNPCRCPWPNIDLLSNFSISLKIDSVDMAYFDAIFSVKLMCYSFSNNAQRFAKQKIDTARSEFPSS